MKKLFSILFALVLVLSFSLVTAVPVGANTDRLVPSPYATIQAAIDDAVDGDTIIVDDGTYTGDLTVDTPNLTLKSVNGSGVTTIQGVDGYVITLNAGADGFTLGGAAGHGFTVLGDATNSTVLLETIGAPSGVTLSYNTLDTTGNPSIAIAVGSGGAANLTISHNTFDLYTSATGVYFDCDPITDLLIDSNIVPGTGNPKWLNFVEDAGVDGAMISNNTVTKGNIVFRMATRTNALNNITIKGNTFAESYIAIGPQGTGSNLVTNLSIIENSFAASSYYGSNAAFEILGTVAAACIDYDTVTVARNNFNNFTSSHWAVINGVEGTTLDAECNWWGSNTGPTHSGNPNGTGGKIREGEWYSDFHPDGDVDYIPWLTGAWTGTRVGLTTSIPDIVAISVDPTSIDFGTLYPGTTSSVETITVGNIGTHEVDVDVEVKGATLFKNYLQMYDSSWSYSGGGNIWYSIVSNLDMGDSDTVSTRLVVPSGYTPGGTETGRLIFEATGK